MDNTSFCCKLHNHQQCIDSALQSAKEICDKHGLRLTALRQRVLSLIWQSHKPLGAYDLLTMLAKEDGRSAAPPTIYRALDFLLENNLIHRLASLNAFVGCTYPNVHHEGHFLICSQCCNVIELKKNTINKAIEKEAKQANFIISTQTVEVVGLCAYCQESSHG